MKRRLIILALLVGLVVMAGAALAQILIYDMEGVGIPSGGGESHGGAYRLNSSIAQPETGAARGGVYTLRGGFSPWACTATAPGVDVLVGSNGRDVLLNWDHYDNNWAYGIRTSNVPYLSPDRMTLLATVPAPGESYTDAGALADLANHFYVVQALTCEGRAMAASGAVGAVTYPLQPGS